MNRGKVIIIAEYFRPMRNSAAVQLEELAKAFCVLGIEPIFIVMDPVLGRSFLQEKIPGVGAVYRVSVPDKRRGGFIYRTIVEFLSPFIVKRSIAKNQIFFGNVAGVVWYSPTIFMGPLVKFLVRRLNCPSYLILRDIFPTWAIDLGLIHKWSLPTYIFRLIEDYQYRQASVIGVQAKANIGYLEGKPGLGARIETLNNWTFNAGVEAKPSSAPGPLSIEGHKFIYAGNMGLAQDMMSAITLATVFQQYENLHLVLIGSGDQKAQIEQMALESGLDNIHFFDQVSPEELLEYYKVCAGGVIFLSTRHTTHNIPGKFISYVSAGLPVFAIVNPGNEIVGFMEKGGVGLACEENSYEAIESGWGSFWDKLQAGDYSRTNSLELAREQFDALIIAEQVYSSLVHSPPT